MKNPKRVAAGKVNRKKRKPLTAEAKQRLQESIQAQQPWWKSTGPNSAAGKSISKMNARKPKPELPTLVLLGLSTLDRLRELIRLKGGATK